MSASAGGGVEALDEGAASDRAGLALQQAAEFLVVGADEDGPVFHRRALSADRDLGFGPGLAGFAGGKLVEALEQALGGAEQALAPLGQGLGLRIGERRGAKHLERDHLVDHGVVSGVVDLQHDVRPEGLDRIEQDRAGVEAEVALARIEHDVVLLEIHGAAGQDAGVGGDRERRGVVPDLDLVDEGPAGVAADDVLEIHPLEAGVQRVAHRMRGEEHAAAAVD